MWLKEEPLASAGYLWLLVHIEPIELLFLLNNCFAKNEDDINWQKLTIFFKVFPTGTRFLRPSLEQSFQNVTSEKWEIIHFSQDQEIFSKVQKKKLQQMHKK